MVCRFTDSPQKGKTLHEWKPQTPGPTEISNRPRRESNDDSPTLTKTAAGQFIAAVFSNPRAHVITKPTRNGYSWQSEFKTWSLTSIAGAIYNLALIVGIRPEGLLRLLVIDIDRKLGRISPYWHPAGLSRQLLDLERHARAAGCGFTLVRSSASGGLHACILLPVAIPAWQAYWVGKALITAAGMEEGPGRCELFPSRIDYCETTDRARWAKSNGFRLPGQDGSALIAGERTANDTDLIYQELLAELQQAEPVPGWDALLETATVLKRSTAASSYPSSCRTPSKRTHGVRWSGAGQSQENLRCLTSWARAAFPEARTIAALAAIIRAAALDAPGFAEHASETTKRDLTGRRGDWAERWARSSLKRSRPHNSPASTGGDKHHNKRLAKLSQAKLTRAWRDAPGSAAKWSKRMVAKVAGLSRQVVDKHWGFWLQLVGGQHPPITGATTPSTTVSPTPPAKTSSLLASPPPRRAIDPNRDGFALISVAAGPDGSPTTRVVPFSRHPRPGTVDQRHHRQLSPTWPCDRPPHGNPRATDQRRCLAQSNNARHWSYQPSSVTCPGTAPPRGAQAPAMRSIPTSRRSSS